jgi:hypothetical protein
LIFTKPELEVEVMLNKNELIPGKWYVIKVMVGRGDHSGIDESKTNYGASESVIHGPLATKGDAENWIREHNDGERQPWQCPQM